jgi:geranylgeranyl diphosphate synthase type II
MGKPDRKLVKQVQILLTERGRKAFEIAKDSILQEKIDCPLTSDALRYFMKDFWYDVVHPALLSLTNEAVGGTANATTHVGAAMVLLAGAADVHDDIIDQSTIKDSKLTVFGKFGKDIAILTGDILLFEGLTILDKACEAFPEDQRKAILELTKRAFFEISSAEAKETKLRARIDASPIEYLNLIRAKASVAEAHARIGAIIGGATLEEIERLGHYGRTIGVLMSVRDEFVDMFEPEELINRIKNECLPLPILFALKDPRKEKRIMSLLKPSLSKGETNQIVELVMEAKQVLRLKKEMMAMILYEEQSLPCVKKCAAEFDLLLNSAMEDL